MAFTALFIVNWLSNSTLVLKFSEMHNYLTRKSEHKLTDQTIGFRGVQASTFSSPPVALQFSIFLAKWVDFINKPITLFHAAPRNPGHKQA